MGYPGKYLLNLGVAAIPESFEDELTAKSKKLRKDKDNKVSWEDVQELLRENLGFWDQVALSEGQEKR